MPRLLTAFSLSLMLSATLCSQNSLSEQPQLPKPDFSCLSREQKDQILISSQENDECHKALGQLSVPPADPHEWTYFSGAFFLGCIAGIVIAGQIHK